jgi:transcriptional regulator with XRE-family HTH domain
LANEERSANERLRHAITRAGLEPEQLADAIEVDEKTVQRWLAGRVPHPRLRRRVARQLERDEHELWPEVATAAPQDEDAGGEILGAWAHAADTGVPDWRELLDEAVDRVELLDYSLLEILSASGTIDTLAAKAASGCGVRTLIAAPDSLWVALRAAALGQPEDHIGRSLLAVEVETARGYLEPLTGNEGVELRQISADPGYRILRFDDQMLISPHLHAISSTQSPLLHLRRGQADGVFDRFASHFENLSRGASDQIDPTPARYPDPGANPDRYQPLTAETQKQQKDHERQRRPEHAYRPSRPTEQVRAELRRPPEPSG